MLYLMNNLYFWNTPNLGLWWWISTKGWMLFSFCLCNTNDLTNDRKTCICCFNRGFKHLILGHWRLSRRWTRRSRSEFVRIHWKWNKQVLTGKSLSEGLIFASTKPQYDKRLFIKLQFQYMKIASSEHPQNMLCT